MHKRAASVQVTPCYPKETEGFVTEVIGLLDIHAEILDTQLRQALVKALILMRNRNTVSHLRFGSFVSTNVATKPTGFVTNELCFTKLMRFYQPDAVVVGKMLSWV